MQNQEIAGLIMITSFNHDYFITFSKEKYGI